MRRRLNRYALPLLAVVSFALFLVLGSSAFALGRGGRATPKPVYQQRCVTGAVKGIVLVVADEKRGFQTNYSTDPSFFKTRWSCKAGTVFQARRVDRGVYDVRLVGNAGGTPLVTPLGDPVKIGTTALPDGGVRIKLLGVTATGQDNAVDESFVVVFV